MKKKSDNWQESLMLENKQRKWKKQSGKERRVSMGTPGAMLFLCMAFLLLTAGCGQGAVSRTAYKVLIGAEPEQLMKWHNCDLLVVDAESLSRQELEKMHQNGNAKIFSYLNIGSIERFRDDYAEFFPLTLSDYRDWLDERWVNVAEKAWQDRIVKKAQKLIEKGVDGLFLDNVDIYYQYPQENIYQGVLTMVRQLERFGKPMLINGGDALVQKAMAAQELPQGVAGVNQETVFSKIDFATGTFGKNAAGDREYYQAYLQHCRQYGLTVYLLEYGASGELAQEIAEYCRENGFFYTIAESLALDK